MKNRICAIIISFNPAKIFLENIASLIKQVSKCVVIDNGSEVDKYLSQIPCEVEIIKLPSNEGIAKALNIGLKYCIENDFPMMLTMDQDTVLDKDAVKWLLFSMHKYKSVSVGINWDGKSNRDESKSYLITSGNLVNVKAAISVGGYDEKLFIDSVDFDFSLKLINNSYKIYKIAKAHAEHNLGEKQAKSNYTTHSVNRYYYIFRNHFVICRRYFKSNPLFIIKKQGAFLFDLFRILIFDKEKDKKFKQLYRGFIDAKYLQ